MDLSKLNWVYMFLHTMMSGFVAGLACVLLMPHCKLPSVLGIFLAGPFGMLYGALAFGSIKQDASHNLSEPLAKEFKKRNEKIRISLGILASVSALLGSALGAFILGELWT